MANTFITPDLVAKTALATLYNSTILIPLVWRDFDSEFTGAQGDTVTIRKPATFTAENFDENTGITLQDATETSTSIVLDTIANVSFKVTDKDRTLELEDYQEQLITPAMEAIVQKIDGELAEALVDAAESGTGGGTSTWSTSTASTVFTGETGARAKLGRNKIPTSQRFAVFSPEGAGVCLTDSKFVEADKSGTTDALREGSIGRVFGFETYESQVFGYGSGDKGQADGVAFHRHAVVLSTRNLETPKGIAPNQVSVASYKNLSLRVIEAYNNTYKRDEVSIDLLYGVDTLRPQGAVQLSFGLGS